jgi:hypothetical protein
MLRFDMVEVEISLYAPFIFPCQENPDGMKMRPVTTTHMSYVGCIMHSVA